MFLEFMQDVVSSSCFAVPQSMNYSFHFHRNWWGWSKCSEWLFRESWGWTGSTGGRFRSFLKCSAQRSVVLAVAEIGFPSLMRVEPGRFWIYCQSYYWGGTIHVFTLFRLLHVFALLGSQKRDFDFFRAHLFLSRGLSYPFRKSTPCCVDLSAWIWHWKSTVFLGDVCNQSCLLLLLCGSPQIVFKLLLSGVCWCWSGSFWLVVESLGFTV